jgi:hypothetical protein
MHTVTFSINYWSRGQVQALFLRHEGYLGAIGAFLKGAEECGKLYIDMQMECTSCITDTKNIPENILVFISGVLTVCIDGFLVEVTSHLYSTLELLHETKILSFLCLCHDKSF